MGRFVASNLNLGQDTRAFWVFVAYPIESCAVWEGEPAQYTGMPLRRALMERYSGVALADAVSEHRGRGEGPRTWGQALVSCASGRGVRFDPNPWPRRP